MYREIVVRMYGEEAIKRVDDLRKAGIDFTDLVYSAVMAYEVEEKSYWNIDSIVFLPEKISE